MIYLRNLIISLRTSAKNKRFDADRLVTEAIILDDTASALEIAIDNQEKLDKQKEEQKNGNA